MSTRNTVEDYVRAFCSVFNNEGFYSNNKQEIISVAKEIKLALEENDGLENVKNRVYNDLKTLIRAVVGNSGEPIILILKNEDNKFDIYAFRHCLEISLNALVSSENFLEAVKRTRPSGMVIADVTATEVINFLKAYYLYREAPKKDKEALNEVYAYNRECLEMISILEKYDGLDADVTVPLKNIILYDGDALPYDLSYLDKYKGTNSETLGEFDNVLDRVCENKYLGTTLTKVSRWW